MTEHTVKHLKDYRPPNYWIDRIDLRVDLDEETTRVESTLKIRRNTEVADETTPLVLDCNKLTVESVVAEDMVLMPHEYDLTDTSFSLAKVPESFTLEIVTLLKPQENTSMMGLYKSGGTFCTQCEAEGFRKITPYPDRPDVMSSFSCIITADRNRYPVLLSNGNPVDQGDLANGRHFVQWEDPFKKPSYLFALVAGDLVMIEDSFTTLSGRDIALRIYVEHENRDKCSHAMLSLKQSMKWDEQRFGREYDLDIYQIVAVNDFNMGAMENKGLNIFNSKYVLAKTETATDMDFMGVQGVIAHEYFHNWTGNRITLKNWFQLSLKEGLTVFRDQEFTSDLNSRAVKRISDVKVLRSFQFPEDSGPMTHPVRPETYIEMNNFYTLTVYNKGAEVIRMMYRILGKDAFRKAMDLYFDTFDGQAVTCEDFVATMEKSSGVDLSLFQRWYRQSGTPRVTMKRRYEAATRKLYLEFTQSIAPDKNQTEKLPMHIPVAIGFMDSLGRDITPQGADLIHLTEAAQTFEFDGMDQDTLPSIFRGFSAPIKLETDFSDDELAFFMACDSDLFNRWDAAQQLFFRELKTLVTAVKEGRPLKVSSHLTQAFGKAAAGLDTDRALLAKTLAIPDEGEIGDQYRDIDVDAIHTARTFLVRSLAQEHRELFTTILKECSTSDPGDISFDAMANRSLKNLALMFLGSLNTEEILTIVYDRFINAGNMTDEISALTILTDTTSPFRDKALDAFYSKWKSDPLVMDKWFIAQAASTAEDTMERVEALSHHPDFTLKNPNRIRSLVGVFAMQNPFIFHSSDGRGYEFTASHIKALDRTNPQIAARLSAAFNHWKRYDLKRQELMKQNLEAIAGQSGLSRDVYEIVNNALSS